MATARESTAEVDPAEEGSETEVDVSVESAGAEPGGMSGALMDLSFVKGLIEAVDGSGIDSIEITRAGTRVKISKTPPAAGPAPTYFAAPPQHAAPQQQAPQAAAPQPSAPPAEASEPETAEAPEDDGLVDITSPMVGTFYRAPAPDAPPYVEEGSQIKKGQTLCILEAMKLMNELEAEVSGEIREILVENAEPVEYGQVLFRVAPS